jgi:hypothetical protein
MLSAVSVGGIGIGKGQSPNTSAGFNEAGFHDIVRQWLVEIFGTGDGGGVVCTIDNLELLKTSEAARDAIEALRDELLNLPGLRWILCGATGIVRGIASTPRMNGYLHAPIEVGDVNHEVAGEILAARTKVYAIDADHSYLPITPVEFAELYGVLHGNIRDTLSAADDFCVWFWEKHKRINDRNKCRDIFIDWVRNECQSRLEAADRLVTKRPWKLFDDIITAGGLCSPGDHQAFGFRTPQAMRSRVITLESSGLIQSVRDDSDNRRKTIIVTATGWMVHYARSKDINSLFSKG